MTKQDEDTCLNFDKFYFNYARFHDNWANKLIHIIWVPILTWTIGVFMALAPLPAPIYGILPWIGTLITTIIYVSMRKSTGLIWLFWCIPASYCCNVAAANKDYEVAGYNVVQLCIGA